MSYRAFNEPMFTIFQWNGAKEGDPISHVLKVEPNGNPSIMTRYMNTLHKMENVNVNHIAISTLHFT